MARRTREWWARLTKEERSELVWLERATGNCYGGGGYLPDDCSECGACGSPMLGSGLCPHCGNRLDALLKKANDNGDS